MLPETVAVMVGVVAPVDGRVHFHPAPTNVPVDPLQVQENDEGQEDPPDRRTAFLGVFTGCVSPVLWLTP